MRVPFFHYTCLDSLPSILEDARVASRYWLATNGKEIVDISIDPKQPVRKQRGLLNYIPLFPGFYTLYRGYELNGYLMQEYDDPKVQNKSFYGTLNKILQFKMGVKYGNVIILLVNDELVYNFADQGKVRFFADLAVKPESVEFPINNRSDLVNCLEASISDSNISGEIDLLDDGKLSITCTSDIEAIIVDNDNVRSQVMTALNSCNIGGQLPEVFISELPRNDPGEDNFDL
jgi:hypothetical protein